MFPEVQILSDVAVSPNLAANDPGVTCAYPLPCRLADGSLVCSYRRGREKHSRDGALICQRSYDEGRAWEGPVVVFDGLRNREPESVHAGSLVQDHRGNLLAIFTAVEVKEPEAYIFSPEGQKLDQRLYLARSPDAGQTWSPPRRFRVGATPRQVYVGSRPLLLAGGEVFLPLEATADRCAGVAGYVLRGWRHELVAGDHVCRRSQRSRQPWRRAMRGVARRTDRHAGLDVGDANREGHERPPDDFSRSRPHLVAAGSHGLGGPGHRGGCIGRRPADRRRQRPRAPAGDPTLVWRRWRPCVADGPAGRDVGSERGADGRSPTGLGSRPACHKPAGSLGGIAGIHVRHAGSRGSGRLPIPADLLCNDPGITHVRACVFRVAGVLGAS